MSIIKKFLRTFWLSDDEMIQESKTKLSHFVADKPEFVAFDPDFDDPYATNWADKILEEESMETGEMTGDILEQLTQTVNEKMDACLHKFNNTRFFIEKAFPNNPGIQHEFGYDNYRHVKDVQLKMVTFMTKFYHVAEKYKVQLLAVNYTQPMIDEILTLANELNDANQQQEEYKDERVVLTQNRVVVLNEIWSFVVNVCNAGQIIFHDNPAKFAQYELPKRSNSTPAVKIKVVMSTVQNPADKVTLGFKGAAGKLVKTAFGDGNIKSITMDGINYILVGNTYLNNGQYTIASEVEIATLDGIIAAGIFLTAVLHPDGLDAVEYDYSNNLLTSIFFLPTNTKAKKIDVSGNNLDQQSMDTMMMTANGWGTDNGYIKADGGTNATLSGQGIAAKNLLISRGWTVVTN